jgi:hypothetical protein
VSCSIPLSWSAIATRPRVDHQTRGLIWTPLPDPVLTIEDARALAAEGRIFMATKHLDDRLVLLVKRAQIPDDGEEEDNCLIHHWTRSWSA